LYKCRDDSEELFEAVKKSKAEAIILHAERRRRRRRYDDV